MKKLFKEIVRFSILSIFIVMLSLFLIGCDNETSSAKSENSENGKDVNSIKISGSATKSRATSLAGVDKIYLIGLEGGQEQCRFETEIGEDGSFEIELDKANHKYPDWVILFFNSTAETQDKVVGFASIATVGGNLINFPLLECSEDIVLGKISNSDENFELATEFTVTDLTKISGLTNNKISRRALSDNIFKNIRNKLINPEDGTWVEFFYEWSLGWENKLTKSELTEWVSPFRDKAYTHWKFDYISSSEKLKFASVSEKQVELTITPPTTLKVVLNDGTEKTYSPLIPFSSFESSAKKNGDDYFGNEIFNLRRYDWIDNYDNNLLNFYGNNLDCGLVPEGDWKITVNKNELAVYNFSLLNPYIEGKEVQALFTPLYKIEKDENGKITSIRIKFEQLLDSKSMSWQELNAEEFSLLVANDVFWLDVVGDNNYPKFNLHGRHLDLVNGNEIVVPGDSDNPEMGESVGFPLNESSDCIYIQMHYTFFGITCTHTIYIDLNK